MRWSSKSSPARQAFYFPLWDLNANWNGKTHYERWSINMFLFKGSEMGNITEHDDEAQISQVSCAQACAGEEYIFAGLQTLPSNQLTIEFPNL